MPIKVLMPALSPTMEKGNLAKWLKQEGDSVKPGDVLAEIETDKATMEVEAVDEGTLAKIVVPEGTSDVPVNDLIALIAEEGEDPAKVEVPADGGGAPTRPQDEAPKGEAPKAESKAEAEKEAPAAPPAMSEAAPAPSKAPPVPKTGSGERIFASPLARRIARDAGLDLKAVKGSGPHGRIIERDVRAAVEKGVGKAEAAAPAAKPEAPKAAAPAGAMAQGMSVDQVKAMYPADSYEEVSLDGMRKTIAKRLLESKQTIPHFYLTLDIELDALMALRKQLNDAATKDKEGKPAYKLSVNDFVIKALALSLQKVPDANAVWAEDRILRFRHSDVGVAVAIDGGLFTPVIRAAETKSLSAISAQMKDLAGRARNKRLKPEEYQGGTTAVSNLGMFGIREFSAVINPPHATILAVGAGEKRVVVKDDAPAVVQAMSVTLSCDHRVVDGALGAELLQSFKGLIENPMGMLV
ncbi:MAG: pyruvate dehydrogenase complex dihydrolipoamide acetyltransferase [Saliniramus fredricksonii]|uniref:Acetyltransferase component of pyruvate dehydrogenase complex n=1 Tax=Saliniramus fredricksonii TaxID=1653334 RepID=A0A0P7Y3V4_9HYPH|nr:pyruvate dehydrogenase complex dihydrolipoamide acetyltransferase [Saliniramus fredricksonii]KPQ11192.1 MAG: pyruvate dehydrogenase complex dihydrolipoamide acetyltransferase [Saliniramus fredricksonii]SCC81722.1 pyruvate dehydrogenase E2 component (dihydrolipoamide acetyltransferase) [Saliniramus fredricksonii]